MHTAMGTTEIFLIAMLVIFTLPYLIWRLGNTDYYAPLVVVQIITGVLPGPGILGRAYPEYYEFVFNPEVMLAMNGIAWWAVMLFVMIAGIEPDLKRAWEHRRASPGLAVRAGRGHGLCGDGAADPDPADGKAGDPARADRPAHPALRQPGRHCDLGRAGADPARLGPGRPPARLPGRVRYRHLRLPPPDGAAKPRSSAGCCRPRR